MDARRALLNAREFGYPTMLQLHRFMVAVSRVSVNHDGRGGSAPDPLVCDHRSRIKHRKVDIRVIVGLASMPGPPGILGRGCRFMVGVSPVLILLFGPVVSACRASLLPFLGSLHWPADSGDLGHFGISYLEVLILFEQWAGHRLLSEKVTRPHVRAHRPISISSVPVSEGIEIRQGCRFDQWPG